MPKENNQKKILILMPAAVILCVGLFWVLFSGQKIKPDLARAGATENVGGFAWSDNIGWISFNNLSDGSGISYGVNINPATGDFSGYAWSDNIGWIGFNRSDAGSPPAPPFNTGSGPIAKYNSGTGEITGWARALANGSGWDGWIRFCDTGVANCSAANQIAKINTAGDWQGWAWADMITGWISLNCSNQGTCGTSNYKVTSILNLNQPPTANSLNYVSPNYCSAGPGGVFSWTFSDSDTGDTQSAYQIQVATDSGFSSIAADSGKVSSGSNSYSPVTGTLSYNIPYYWRVKVWDNHDAASVWASASFTTPKHQYPTANFSWMPLSPSAQEDVQFADQSVVYGGAAKSGWAWTFQDATPSTASQQNPIVKFNTTGAKNATLQITDSDGYACSAAKTLNANVPLPNWKEVAP